MKKKDKRKMNRKAPKVLGDMPTWIIVTLGVLSSLVVAYYGYVFKVGTSKYFEAVSTVPLHEWGASAWALTFILAMLGACTCWHGMIAKACYALLTERWFK